MRKNLILAVGLAALAALSADAAGFEAGKGVANDHATGANDRDVTFVVRGAGNGYGYRQYDLPIGFTFGPWSAPNFECAVYGVRLNLGWSEYAGTYGLDGGLFSQSKGFGGIAANFCGNVVEGRAAGVQVGLVNDAHEVRGIQIGAVNLADSLCGLQIGFLNFNGSGAVLPIVNAGW